MISCACYPFYEPIVINKNNHLNLGSKEGYFKILTIMAKQNPKQTSERMRTPMQLQIPGIRRSSGVFSKLFEGFIVYV